MPINQADKDKPVRCIACGKIIAQGYIADGAIQIQCKCGVKNRLEAKHKPEGRSELCERVRSVIDIPVDRGSTRTFSGRR